VELSRLALCATHLHLRRCRVRSGSHRRLFAPRATGGGADRNPRMSRTPTRSCSANQTSFGAAGHKRPPADVRALSTELIRWEGYCPHMFVDEAGQVTTGVGHRMPNAAAAIALPWRHRATDRTATPEEIRSAF